MKKSPTLGAENGLLPTSDSVFEAFREHFFPSTISFLNIVVVHGGIGLLHMRVTRRLPLVVKMLEIDTLSNIARHKNILL